MSIELICVACGKEATEGSIKHPYCKEDFEKIWGGEEQKYWEWVDTSDTQAGMIYLKKHLRDRGLLK